jgi:glycosyltransferase involved in cell wall biosynthesis
MRVLVVIDSLAAGGAEMLLADLAAGAPSAGIELCVAYLGEREGSPAAARLRELGVEPVNLRLQGLVHPGSLRRVRSHVRSVAPDIVHTQLGYADAVGGVAARSLRVPSVSTIHVMEWLGGGREGLRERLIATARRRTAAVVVAVSDAARLAVVDAGWERPERVVTVRNGIDARIRAGAGAAVRREAGISPDALVVGQLAVLREGKGHSLAAAAVGLLARELPAVHLLVAGDGPARDEVEAALEGLGPRATALGHRSDPMAVLDAVDVLVHPSRVDAFPTALLEAMAAGVPVVATPVGGIPEIVVPEETGLLTSRSPDAPELAAALGRLLRDDGLRATLAKGSRERFEAEFTAVRWAERLRALYDMVLSYGGRRSA